MYLLLERKYGKDSVQYQREVNRLATLQYETKLKLGGLNDRDVAFLVEQRNKNLEAEISLRAQIQLKKDKLKQDKLDDKERIKLEAEKKRDEEALNALKGRNLANYLRGKYKSERLAKDKAIQDELDLNAQKGKNLAVLLKIRYRNIRLAKEAEKKAEEELQELRKKNMDALYASRGSRVGPAPAQSPFSAGMAGAFSTSEDKIKSDGDTSNRADALADYIEQLNHEKMVEGELVGLFGSETYKKSMMV